MKEKHYPFHRDNKGYNRMSGQLHANKLNNLENTNSQWKQITKTDSKTNRISRN